MVYVCADGTRVHNGARTLNAVEEKVADGMLTLPRSSLLDV